MKYTLATCLLFALLSLHAQERGVTPTNNPKTKIQNPETYAVVVGISDYQKEMIRNLHLNGAIGNIKFPPLPRKLKIFFLIFGQKWNTFQEVQRP